MMDVSSPAIPRWRRCPPSRMRAKTVLAIILMCLAVGHAQAATVIINNTNVGLDGFNDPTPVAPVPGNPATTLGAQRLAAFQAAANEWGAMLVSPVSIVIDAKMTSLSCSQNSAILGSAGPTGSISRDFPGAPVPGTWFPQALVNSIRGFDIDTGNADVSANFNQDIGTPGCLQSLGWSYVIGAPAPSGTIPFTDTVIHEIGHGLGFLTFVDKSTGALLAGYSDQYTRFLMDETPSPVLWTALNDAGRAASAKDNGQLTWSGSQVTNVAGLLGSGRHATSGRVRMYAPATLASGSSVSHWDTVLTPNEIMEPSLQSSNEKRLSNHLMLDIGWKEMLALAATITDGQTSIAAGSATSYGITITNNGPGDITVVNASVSDTMPAALTGVSWTCAGSGGASCGVANGTGSISTTVTVPLGGAVTFTINATISGSFSGTLSNTVTVGMPANIQNTVSSVATDNTNVTAVVTPTAGISVSAISGNTTEAGGSAFFSVVLDSQPTGSVTIGLSSNDTTEGTLTQTSLVFTAGNWDSAQLVTVTGVDDDVDDGNVAYGITTAAASSSDSNYNLLNASDVAVTNLDNDTAGITVSLISGDTTEAGATSTFTMVLDSEPVANVVIGLSSSDTTEGTVLPNSLTFTSLNWDKAQEVTVTGVDDTEQDGDVGYAIVTAPAASSDGKYNNLNSPDVSVINLDDASEDVIFVSGFD